MISWVIKSKSHTTICYFKERDQFSRLSISTNPKKDNCGVSCRQCINPSLDLPAPNQKSCQHMRNSGYIRTSYCFLKLVAKICLASVAWAGSVLELVLPGCGIAASPGPVCEAESRKASLAQACASINWVQIHCL